MSAILSALGLHASSPLDVPPSYGAYYLIFHFLWAYAGLSSRPWKRRYGIDHQVSPREDLTKYGTKAVESGKITQAQLNQMKRVEAASANSVEHYTLFVGSMLWAHMAGLPTTTINRSALAYTVARVAYAGLYIFADRYSVARWRGLVWWVSNVVCLRLLWIGGKAMNNHA